MTTLKIKYTSSPEFQELLKEYRREQSTVIRTAFKKLQEGKTQNEIRAVLKERTSLPHMDSWWIQSAIAEAQTMFSAYGKRKVIFGGKGSLKRFLKGLITKDDLKESRLMPLVCAGEANCRGSRKFRLDVINNQITFHDKRGKIKHVLDFQPQLRDRLEQLLFIEEQASAKKQPLTVKITDTHIHLTFTEKQKDPVPSIPNRVLAIDSNPNSIGWSVCDIKDGDPVVVDSGIIDLQKLNKQSTNKKHHETFEVSKFLADKAVHHHCSTFAAEDLCIQSNDHKKGRSFNKVVNNDWIRIKLFQNLKKRCFINNIKFVEVNPAYTSVIGGTLHRNYPDPIAPTLEIARRAMFKYQKSKFYPAVPSSEVLNELWKQTSEKSLETWKEVSDWLKKTKHKYRVSPVDFSMGVCRLKSIRSTVYRRSQYKGAI